MTAVRNGLTRRRKLESSNECDVDGSAWESAKGEGGGRSMQSIRTGATRSDLAASIFELCLFWERGELRVKERTRTRARDIKKPTSAPARATAVRKQPPTDRPVFPSCVHSLCPAASRLRSPTACCVGPSTPLAAPSPPMHVDGRTFRPFSGRAASHSRRRKAWPSANRSELMTSPWGI